MSATLLCGALGSMQISSRPRTLGFTATVGGQRVAGKLLAGIVPHAPGPPSLPSAPPTSRIVLADALQPRSSSALWPRRPSWWRPSRTP